MPFWALMYLARWSPRAFLEPGCTTSSSRRSATRVPPTPRQTWLPDGSVSDGPSDGMKRSNRSWFRRLTDGSRSNEMVSVMSPEYETVIRVPLRIFPAAVIISPAG